MEPRLFQYAEKEVPVRVWDLYVRLTHWIIAVLVLLSWIAAELGWLGWHKWFGYAILSLVIFRIYWGFCGSTTARFAHFLRGPESVGCYLRMFCSRSGYTPSVGHNPLGSWNVLAMLLLLLLQAGLGLFVVDMDGIESGPLSSHVRFESGRSIGKIHVTVFNILLLFIVVHIVAVFMHLFVKRENLIRPMLTGVKSISLRKVPSLSFAPLWHALPGLIACSLLFVGLVWGL